MGGGCRFFSLSFLFWRERSEGLHDVGHASVATGRGELRMRSSVEIFLEFLKETLKGIVRAISAHLFQKTFLNNEKTTRGRSKRKGGSHKN